METGGAMTWNLEWLNQNSARAYPFKEDASLRDTLDAVRVPNTMLADLVLVVPPTTAALTADNTGYLQLTTGSVTSPAGTAFARNVQRYARPAEKRSDWLLCR